MKIINLHKNYSQMNKAEQEKVSILKLAPDRKHVKGVGMRDGKFFVLVEQDIDDKYLSFIIRRHRKEMRNNPESVIPKIKLLESIISFVKKL